MIQPSSAYRLSPSPWTNLTVSQILLPVLCAVFIALVILVIACCLIQRKPKSAGHWREKSCYTIETSHEAFDQDIYDVIDEVSVASLTPEKSFGLNGKLDSNYMIGSHLLRHSKMVDVFPTKSLGIPFQTAPSVDVQKLNAFQHSNREWVWNNLESVTGEAYSHKLPDCKVTCAQNRNHDEGIYESLDRHCSLKNKQKEETLLHSAVRSSIPCLRTIDCHSGIYKDLLQSNSMYDTLKCSPKPEGPCDNSDCGNVPNDMCPVLNTSSSYETKEANKIVCQLSMFKLSGVEEKPTLIEKAYYRVQPQTTPCTCSHFEDISALFHDTSLRIVHTNVREMDPENGQCLDLVLRPLKEVNECVQHLNDKNSRVEYLEKILTPYRKSLTADSQRYPALPVKKSETYRGASSDFSKAKEQYPSHEKRTNSYHMEGPMECPRIPTKHSYIVASPEAKRISAKLGPLPPLPVQCGVSCDKKNINTSVMDDSSYLNCECSFTSNTATTFTPPAKNFLTVYPITTTPASRSTKQKDFDTSVGVSHTKIFYDRRPKVNFVTGEVDDLDYRVHSVNNTCISHLEKAVTENENNVRDNAKIYHKSESYNHYFILEPSSDVSGLNSDNEDSSDCQEVRVY